MQKRKSFIMYLLLCIMMACSLFIMEDNAYAANDMSAVMAVSGSTSDIEKVVGSSIKLDVKAEGGAGSYTYKFAVCNVATGKWTILSDYSNASSYTYQLNYTGKKIFSASVKDKNGKVVAANRINVNVIANSVKATLTVNDTTAAISCLKGEMAKLSVKATGGSGVYSYRYAVLNEDTGKWSVLADYNSKSTYSYQLNYSGKKTFAVSVKDSTGKIVTTNRVTVVVYNSKLSGTLTINGTKADVTVTEGNILNLSVKAAGGTGGYTYKYAVWDANTKEWSILQDFSTSSSCAYIAKDAGKKQFAVSVKDSMGNVAAVNRMNVTVKEFKGTLKAGGDVQDSISAYIGTTTSYEVSVAGGSGSYQYQFRLHNLDNDTWSILCDYSSSARYSMTYSQAGNYSIVAMVKDSDNNIVSTNIVNLTVKTEEERLAEYVDEVIRLVNVERNNQGLPSLTKNTKLCALANERAQEIVENFDHTRPNGESCFSILHENNIFYWTAGENIAMGQRTPAIVMNSWMNSEGHRENILTSYFSQIGVGVAYSGGRYYWVQIFIG